MKRCAWVGDGASVADAAMSVCFGWMFGGSHRRLAEDEANAKDIASVYIFSYHIVSFW